MPNTPAEAKLQAWLSDGEELGISSIAWSELLCGPLTPKETTLAEMLVPTPEPFLASDAHRAAELFNGTGRRSRSLADCQIAAVALGRNARIATVNTSDFTLFQSHGLSLA